jgi:DNA-binding CsgD family transcriptional regulator
MMDLTGGFTIDARIRLLDAQGPVAPVGIPDEGVRSPARDRNADPATQGNHRPEQEVLTLVGCGLTNGEIATKLCISVATAKAHVARLLTKLEARDRVQLVIVADKNGYVTLSASEKRYDGGRGEDDRVSSRRVDRSMAGDVTRAEHAEIRAARRRRRRGTALTVGRGDRAGDHRVGQNEGFSRGTSSPTKTVTCISAGHRPLLVGLTGFEPATPCCQP